MSTNSEQTHLYNLRKNNQVTLKEIYLACVSVANSGSTLPEEIHLQKDYVCLLQVRRLIYNQHLELALNRLDSIETEDPFLQGDSIFLRAQIFHRQGSQTEAARLMSDAANFYAVAGDFHRELRARVNGSICVSSLESCIVGDLYIYEQEARRRKYHDILANILRTKSMELLLAHRFQEAFVQAQEASNLYQVDGYLEDGCVAVFISAIAQILLGDFIKAQQVRMLANIPDGKAKSYREIYEDLLNGKRPKIFPGHPLSRMDWKTSFIKPESIPGKLLAALRARPQTKDELIVHIWGENAKDSSYYDRLFTAIGFLRKDKSLTILFDGVHYRIDSL